MAPREKVWVVPRGYSPRYGAEVKDKVILINQWGGGGEHAKSLPGVAGTRYTDASLTGTPVVLALDVGGATIAFKGYPTMGAGAVLQHDARSNIAQYTDATLSGTPVVLAFDVSGNIQYVKAYPSIGSGAVRDGESANLTQDVDATLSGTPVVLALDASGVISYWKAYPTRS